MKKRLLSKKIKLLFILILTGIVFLSVRAYNLNRFHLEKQTRFMMDTYVTIYAVGPKKITAPAIDSALNRMQEIDVKFNTINPKSPIYAFNHQGVPISDEEILNLVKISLELSRYTEGAFDITVFPLIDLWGFYTDTPHLPSDEKIKETLKNVGYKHLVFRDGKLEKNKEGVAIELGAIAKGYAVSQAVKVLKEHGVSSALVDAGGDVYALGKKDTGLWKVGIQAPRDEDLLGYIETEDLAIMGSGDYERFFIKDGKRYHHIFNPKTGYPVEGLSGITVVYPDPTLADAWATALFVIGQEKGLEIVKATPGLEAIMVTTSGEILYSDGLKNALKVVPKTK